MFVERQRLDVEELEIGAEHVEKLLGRRVAAFFFAFENHNLSKAHGVSDLFVEQLAKVWSHQQHHMD